MIEVTSRHRQESELELERLRTAQVQSERTLEARERAHRQRVKGLEEQVRVEIYLLNIKGQTIVFLVQSGVILCPHCKSQVHVVALMIIHIYSALLFNNIG